MSHGRGRVGSPSILSEMVYVYTWVCLRGGGGILFFARPPPNFGSPIKIIVCKIPIKNTENTILYPIMSTVKVCNRQGKNYMLLL